MAEEESLKVGKSLQNLKDMVSASASHAVVFETKRLQARFIAEHVGEVGHGIIV